ncbi:MAG: bifunctional 2-polyprenyl-6-hydroxyphenol methylase/3-demethylubiquinol 3-O-methyltransferase UbiG [Alphaproteobacteria bacterium]|nr:bifunctional 2-polyprenyl-6-hydroxyphenol methylase/3-demethylubiquinol 3-O-methyltransferase UbiG [Alphaproteobacteria bacterium]OJV13186.1 MAG: bifunctional 3-demethylubiquinol 3-O-methyltransferase/2-polyprenyl-6-hydroxyphenol methylase [Alphaproteobacteria bacterium 33-17]
MATTIDPKEVEKFSKLSSTWWNENGPLKPLHKMNPCRVKFVRDQIYSHFNCDSLEGLNIIDVGCGGGLLSEPLARLDGNVTGVDATEKNIVVAKEHAKLMNLNIEYLHCEASTLVDQGRKFDVVIALETIEHVSDVDQFMQDLSKLMTENGIIILSTINKTAKSFLFAIVGAEYVLRWLPKGTHDWHKFLKPSEVVIAAEKHNLKAKSITGMTFNPMKNAWNLSEDLDVNYFVALTR